MTTKTRSFSGSVKSRSGKSSRSSPRASKSAGAIGKKGKNARTDGRYDEMEWTVTKDSSLWEWKEEVLENAKNTFGTTEDFRSAGFILPDGEMLDFGRDYSRRDHTEIGSAFPEDIDLPEEITKHERDDLKNNIVDFERLTDSVRVFLQGSRKEGYDLNVQLSTFQEISDAQWETLKNMAVWANIDSLYYDLYNQDVILYGSEYRPDFNLEDPGRAIEKLKRHFERVQRQEVRDRWTEAHRDAEANGDGEFYGYPWNPREETRGELAVVFPVLKDTWRLADRATGPDKEKIKKIVLEMMEIYGIRNL